MLRRTGFKLKNEDFCFLHFQMTQTTKKIRFGLTAIKGLGEETVDTIMLERKNGGKFKSLQDFAKRIPARLMNKKTLEALAFSGALDAFGDRGAIVDSLEDLSKFAREQEQQKEAGQIGLFGGVDDSAVDFTLKDTKATKEDILRWERESLGLFVSDHPLRGLDGYFQKYGALIGKLTAENDGGEKRTLHGIVTAVRKITTKKGKSMAIVEVEDTSGKIECAIFPMIYDKVKPSAMERDAFVRIKGKIDERNGGLNCIIDEIKVGDLKNVQQMAEAFVETDEKKESGAAEKLYQIDIPDGTTKEAVGEIKKMLMAAKSANPDDQKVQILIDGKTVDLPFTINYSEDLRQGIEGVLK